MQAGALEQALKGIAGYKPDTLALEDAARIISAVVQPVVERERVPLRAALGRVLAGDLRSPIDIPDAPCSAMDGWALRAADLKAQGDTELVEVGTSLAGRPFASAIGAGQCVRIMTGGLVPQGADTVVMQEVVQASGGKVRVPSGQREGRNVRVAGEDVAKGQVALRAGTIVRPAAIGMGASLGMQELEVMRRLRVAFFSTGDELTPLGQPLAPGQLYESNRHALWAMLERLGCEAIDLGVVRDDVHALDAALRKGAQADAIVTTGGASEGEADFTRQVAARLGEVAFWKLALRPGRPFAFGTIGSAAFFGLPGNPVGSMVVFYGLVQPALLKMAGSREPAPPLIRARAVGEMKKRVGRAEYQCGIVERVANGELEVRLTGAQGAAMMGSLCEANCLVVLERARGDVARGEPVDVVLLNAVA